MALGLGATFVGVQAAANAGVPAGKASLAAALISASSTLGGALGLAIFSAIAASRTHQLLARARLPARRAHLRVRPGAHRLRPVPDSHPHGTHPRSRRELQTPAAPRIL